MLRSPCDRNFWLLAALLTAGALLPAVALGGPQDEITRRDWGIGGFRAPPRWDLQPPDRPTYPQMLAHASRGHGADRSVITLVARRLMPGTSVLRFANESEALRQAGVKDIRLQPQPVEGWGRRVQLDATLEGPPRRILRQIFLTQGNIGYVLTLLAPQSQALPRLRDLEDVASGLVPLPPDPGARPETSPQPRPAQAQPPEVTPATPGEGPR